MAKKLRAAGAMINVTAEQAKALPGMSHLLNVVEDGAVTIPIIEETEPTPVTEVDMVGKLVEDIEIRGPPIEETQEDESFAEEEDEDGSQKKKYARLTSEEVSEQLRGKFMNLVDLIPPIPQKGTFKVETIKESAYFFS